LLLLLALSPGDDEDGGDGEHGGALVQGQSPRQDLEVDFLGWWYIILVVLGASCWLQRKKDFSVKVFAFYLLLLLIVYIYYYTVINFIYHYIYILEGAGVYVLL